MKSLREIVQFEKARSVLFGQWGFGMSEQQVQPHTPHTLNIHGVYTKPSNNCFGLVGPHQRCVCLAAL